MMAIPFSRGGDHEANCRPTAQNEAIVQLCKDIGAVGEARCKRRLKEVRREEKDTAHRDALNLRLTGIEDSIKSIYSLGR